MRNHRRSHLTIPVAIGMGFVPLVSWTMFNIQREGWVMGLAKMPSALIPYDNATKKITFANLGYGLYPILAGFLVHKVVGGMMGVNKTLAAARIPFIRI